MTEAEWLSDTSSGLMVMQVVHATSGRKLRLFAVACCNRVIHPMLGEFGQIAIDAAERYADGEISVAELEIARSDAGDEWDQLGTSGGTWQGPNTGNPFWSVAREDSFEAAMETPEYIEFLFAGTDAGWEERWGAEIQEHVPIARDIFGNPFRPITLDPTWRTETVVGLATAIYDDRAFERMPILADALQDAGCENADILTHCREPGVHVRGCWVVDLLLGKE